MTELTPRARALFEAGRRSLEPKVGDQERVLSALSARIGGLDPGGDATRSATRSATPSAPTNAPANATGLGWPSLAAIAVGLAVTGAGLFALFRPATPAPVAPARSDLPVTIASSAPNPATTAAPVAEPPAAGNSLPLEPVELPRAGARPSVPAEPSDRLAAEVAILSDAERDLHAGQYQSALVLLDEHRRKFPNGTLAQERMAARVQALCGLGRVNEARTALAHLTRVSPKSPHEEPAREACAAKN